MTMIAETTQSGVRIIAFDRPDALNAFTPQLLEDLIAAVRSAGSDMTVGAIVLCGMGRAFSAGVDLKLLKGINPEAGRVGNVFDGAAYLAAAAIRRSLKPVIAKVHGFCFTGALELALHCDFIFTTRDTKFGDTHAKWGLRPTWGMSQNLARAVGVRRARELSLSARTFTGEDAANWGLANAAFDDIAALDRETMKCAVAISENSRGAVSAYRKLYALHEENHPLEDALRAELELEFPEIDDTQKRLETFGA